MDLNILLDVSGSMGEISGFSKGTNAKKIDIVKDHIISFLKDVKKNQWDNIHLYTFSKDLFYIDSFSKGGPVDNSAGWESSSVTLSFIRENSHIMNAVKKIESLKFDLHGGTRIWDSINKLISTITPNTNSKILCVTDGEDSGSISSYNHVKERVNKDPNIDLLILDIEGKLNRIKDESDDIIIGVNKPQEVKKILEDSQIMDISEQSCEGLDISTLVVPVVPCSEDELAMVRKAIQEAVPYLERLTDLRYYPVPTYIVDEYTIKRYIEKPVHESRLKDELKKDIEEILRFYFAVTLAIHTGSFSPRIERSELIKYWEQYSYWSSDSRETLRSCAEGCLGVKEFVENGKFGFEQVYRLPELLGYADDISKYEAAMNELVNYLKVWEKNFKNVGFIEFNELTEIIRPGKPELSIWEKYLLPEKKYKKLLKYLKNDGNWRNDITSIIGVYELVLPVLIKLLRKWELIRKWGDGIAREIHTYGVYLFRSNKASKLQRLLRDNGYPDHFLQEGTGKVLICLERCKNRAKEHLENQPANSLNPFKLISSLLKATVIHEHAHAICYEGVGKGNDKYYSSPVKKGRKRHKAISETLAEWATMNYFKVIGDEDLYEIIKCHALAGEFPKWPYRGALILEFNEQDLSTETKFRSLLNYFRNNSHAAYRLLRSW